MTSLTCQLCRTAALAVRANRPAGHRVAPSFASASISTRRLHAFAPSVPLFKKKAASVSGQAGLAAEEFEEDLFDDDDVSHSTAATSPKPQSGAKVQQQSFYDIRDDLRANLALSPFQFRSNIPSGSKLRRLIVKAGQTPNETRDVLDIVASWKSKAVPFPANTTTLLLRYLLRTQNYVKAVHVLADRKTYGLDLSPPSSFASSETALPLQRLFAKLAQTPSPTEKELEALQLLLDVQRLHLPREDTTIASIALAKLGLQMEAKDAPFVKALEEVLSWEASAAAIKVKELQSRSRKSAWTLMKDLARTLEERDGRTQDAARINDLVERVKAPEDKEE